MPWLFEHFWCIIQTWQVGTVFVKNSTNKIWRFVHLIQFVLIFGTKKLKFGFRLWCRIHHYKYHALQLLAFICHAIMDEQLEFFLLLLSKKLVLESHILRQSTYFHIPQLQCRCIFIYFWINSSLYLFPLFIHCTLALNENVMHYLISLVKNCNNILLLLMLHCSKNFDKCRKKRLSIQLFIWSWIVLYI